jgi:CBS domain containing-hemolysin-like protein
MHEDIPDDVQGLDTEAVEMMTGAMNIGEVPIQEIFTPISKVTKFYLDTNFNMETIKEILKLGFSRIPVAYSQKHPVIVGILLVKTLLAVEKNGETIAKLYNKRKIELKVPLFLTQDANLTKVAKNF